MQRIAIIGIGCRLPGGADGPERYWSLLTEGRCAIREIPRERWALAGFHDAAPRPDRSYSRWGGFVGDIGGFDPSFFGLSPREAEAMDPQQRLLLQVACEAVADARMPIAALRNGVATGVYVGVSNTDYALLQRLRPGHGDIQAGTGTALSIVANRVSNRLDLSGPSLGVDTACSSSLVALDMACRHLSDGACDMALAAGVNILLDPRMFITFSRAHMLSPTGRIRAFDRDADGFVRGEGVGVVLLRRLDDARAAGDRIYAVIDATAINQDGRTGTLTEPSPAAQRAMLEAVVARAGIAPGDIDYVEAHGTGTPVGDPIEANAIGVVLGGRERRAPLPIASVKTNIGHLEPAAGIAGLIKAALVLHHGVVPPSLGFDAPNPAIDFSALNIAVPQATQALPDVERAHHALVNSFGFGGTNACALLSAPSSVGRVKSRCAAQPRVELDPAIQSQPVPGMLGRASLDPAYADAPLPVPLSGPTERHLLAYAAALASAIESGCLAERAVEEIAAALAAQRDPYEYRAVVIARTPAELVVRLRCLAEGREWPRLDKNSPPEILRGIARPGRKLCFTMTGQGGQWWTMGRELIEREPVFRLAIERFDAVFQPVGGWSVLAMLLADEATSRIDDAAITPAVMFAFQSGLADVWRARGVTPDIVLGHSFGEVTAAYLAGGLEASAIARLVDQRGLIRHRVDRVGTMAAIGLGATEIAALLPDDGSIEIGGYNAPRMVTLTGDETAIDALITRLNGDDPSILTRKLALDFAYHSSWFEPVEHIFKAQVGTLHTSPPHVPVISTVTGGLNTRFDTDYWWQNLRQPVRYHQAIDTALDLGADVFVELGPHRTLSGMTAACAAARSGEVVTVTSLDRRWGDLVSLSVATAQLWVAGVAIDWAGLTGQDGRSFALPALPWLDRPVWLEPDEAAHYLRPSNVHPLLGRRDGGPGHGWTADIALATQGWLGDHRLDGACVFPAAAYLEMLTVAAREVVGADAIELTDIAFPAALFIGDDDEIQLATRYVSERRKLTIHSRLPGGGAAWELRATATVLGIDRRSDRACEIRPTIDSWGAGSRASIRPTPGVLPLSDGEAVDVARFYRDANAAGYGWGPGFQGLRAIERGSRAARGVIALGSGVVADGFHLDPRLLDCALQLMLASGTGADLLGVMPTGISRMTVTGSATATAIALGRTCAAVSGDGITADIEIAREDGETVVRIDGLRARRRAMPAARTREIAPRLYGETFEPITTAPAAEAEAGEAENGAEPGRWLIIAGRDGAHAGRIADALAARGAACGQLIIGNGRLAPRLAVHGAGICGILYAVPLDIGAVDDGKIAAAAHAAAREIIELGRALQACQGNMPARLVVLTNGARVCETTDAIRAAGLAQSPVLAAARTIAMELPELRVQLIDCDGAALDDMARLANVIHAPSRESEIAVRGTRVLAARLEELGSRLPPPPRLLAVGEGGAENFALRHEGPPGAEGLYWQQIAPVDVNPDDVEVEVRAVGLNFRDLMAVSGLLPADAEPRPAIEALGLELSGTVRCTGADVDDLKPGDAVFGMGRGVLRRHAVLPRLGLHRLPQGLSHSDAATIPSAFITAHYALNLQARLQPGETVLIHSATGGVGLAAIVLARRAGAKIIATAGTPERREHLRSLGIEHVFASRSAGFADDVLQATQGRGVDVVLNSLSGALIEKGLKCLGPYGRFIELGKRDIHDNAAVGLKALKANISFHVVDVAALIENRPEIAARLLSEIVAMVEAGEIQPLPARNFSAQAVVEAFQYFGAGRHIGKNVVSVGDANLPVRSGMANGAALDRCGTYVVTGGTQGFGLTVARWLADQGAGRVIVASRRGALPPDVRSVLDREAADRFEAVALDVTDPDYVAGLLRRIEGSGKPLRGIVHAAVVYDDALLADMDGDRIDRVLAPKIDGALHLSLAVERIGAKLDFFVTFSSLAQVVGWSGQSNYAAANGFLEALAWWQRARDIPGTCINWGALGESGHVARLRQMQSYLDSSGWTTMSNDAALAALAQALDFDLPVVTIAAADWQRLAATHVPIATSSRMSRLLSACASGRGDRGSLVDLDDAALAPAVLALVRTQIARVLRLAPEDLSDDQTLAAIGIDSLSSFELHNRIEQAAGVTVPMSRYTKARRLLELSALVASLVRERRPDE